MATTEIFEELVNQWRQMPNGVNGRRCDIAITSISGWSEGNYEVFAQTPELRLRVVDQEINAARREGFDRWGNSVYAVCPIPSTIEGLICAMDKLTALLKIDITVEDPRGMIN